MIIVVQQHEYIQYFYYGYAPADIQLPVPENRLIPPQ